MKKIILLLFILITLPLYSDAWQSKADNYWNKALKSKNKNNYSKAIKYYKKSINAELKSKKKRINNLSELFSKIGQTYQIIGEYEKSIYYFKLLIKSSKKNNNNKYTSDAFRFIGDSYSKLNDLDNSLNNYEKSLEPITNSNFNDRKLIILNNIAKIYKDKQNFNKSLKYYKRSLILAKKLKSGENISTIKSNIGILYFYNKKYGLSMKYFTETIDLYKKLNKKKYLSIDLSNIGSVYRALGKYGEAINYLNKALIIDREMDNKINIATRTNNLGRIYLKLGDSNLALDYFKESLEIYKKQNNIINTASLLSNIGESYELKGDYNSAVNYYIKALKLDKKLKDTKKFKPRLSDIGSIYNMRGKNIDAIDFFISSIDFKISKYKGLSISTDQRNICKAYIILKNYNNAKSYIKEALITDRRNKNIYGIIDDLKYSGIIEIKLNNYKKAITFLKDALKELKKIDSNNFKFQSYDEIYKNLILSYTNNNQVMKGLIASEILSIKKIKHFSPKNKFTNSINKSDFVAAFKNQDRNESFILYSNFSFESPIVIIKNKDSINSVKLNLNKFIRKIFNIYGKEIKKSKKKNYVSFYFLNKKTAYIIEFQDIINFYKTLLSKKYISLKEKKIVNYMGTELYNLLFKDIEHLIGKKNKLLIKPDSIFSYIPFESLIMPDGRYLVEKYTIKYTHSFTLSNKAFKENISKSSNNFSNTPEISNLKFNIPIIDLKKIHISKKKSDGADGIDLIVNSFLSSGNKNISLSLWQVDDKLKIKFFIDLYKLMTKEKISYIKALTKIKRSFINYNSSESYNKKMSNPYYWASFIYFGD